jgi:Fe-S oxidoreductase
MATYKAEFLSHYYARRLRPRHAYAFGRIHDWLRVAQPLAPLLNIAAATPLAAIAKVMSGMHRQRRIPRLARTTFRSWFRSRAPRNVGRDTVVLWPDTFNDRFHPQTARAAVTVLEALGYRVEIPPGDVCCGRPLYDYGMLDTAKRLLRRDLDALRPYLEAGATVVGLEPSCVSVFREELPNFFPDDPMAQRLRASARTLAEFVARHRDFALPKMRGRAIVHGHCHDKAVLDFSDEVALLRDMGLDVDEPEASCCGMAGAFGFEREHYDLSMRLAERALLPAVRASDAATLVIADGFSCREQIHQGTGRLPLHFAEVLARGIAS